MFDTNRLNQQLNPITKHKGNKDWQKWFSIIDELEELNEQLNTELHSDVTEKTKKEIAAKLKELEQEKTTLQDLLSTKKPEYDALNDVAYYLDEELKHFSE